MKFTMIRMMTTSIVVLFLSFRGFSHGEDSAGPHGGFIQMPGAFHVELVPDLKKQGHYKIYLLNEDFKYPWVRNSAVKLQLERKGKIIETTNSSTCVATFDYFDCTLSNKLEPKDKILIESSRAGRPGGVVNYEFPFTLKKQVRHEEEMPHQH